MAERSSNEYALASGISVECEDAQLIRDRHTDNRGVASTSNLLVVRNSSTSNLLVVRISSADSSSPNDARKEKASSSCKDGLKRYSKFWNFLHKRKTDCNSCDQDTSNDDGDDQSEPVAVSCLCTGLKRQAKPVQEFPTNFEAASDVSCLPSEAHTPRSNLPYQVLPSNAECLVGTAAAGVEIAGQNSIPPCTEAVVRPPVEPRCCIVWGSNSRPEATNLSCSLRNQRTSSNHIVPANCGQVSNVTVNEDIIFDCAQHSHNPNSSFVPQTIHTQVDYIHYLVPDLKKITNCSYYWGVMDRYEAERLLDGRPEGTFLLRDSAQEEFLFSVSFRRYSRSLHARVEHWNHRFSFDAHDTNVFASPSVCGLIEHYKDPACCMFFEPMLTLPLVRTFPFPLQHLCRAVIGNIVTYDGISYLPIPKSLHHFLQYYHYKKKVRVRRFDAVPNHQ